MSNSTFCKYFQDVSKHIQEISWNSFKEAAGEEARIAKDEDCVDENGTPIITVIVDGAWSKRSYRKNYNSLSGVVRIEISVLSAIKHWIPNDNTITSKVGHLKEDILNTPHHVFGDHTNCQEYYCSSEKQKTKLENGEVCTISKR
ncbi:hypothetical protein RN001_012239 [Aquatica leii]|uniref:Mutator-like transposase domain-containing protein n=1 Tax=Aquatica leii TaxID=1421715 RepID=A0AAN7P3K1_9COLE|nr:hypothetical protein RN001_012239 [Aquatica leii]